PRIATLTYPPGHSTDEEFTLLKAVGNAFPAVAAMRVRDVLDAVGATVTNLVLGIRAASALTLIVAILVLAGALAAGHRRRVYEAVILKTLGATRMRLVCAYAIEYFTLCLATALLGVAAGAASGVLRLRRTFHRRARADRHVQGTWTKARARAPQSVISPFVLAMWH